METNWLHPETNHDALTIERKSVIAFGRYLVHNVARNGKFFRKFTMRNRKYRSIVAESVGGVRNGITVEENVLSRRIVIEDYDHKPPKFVQMCLGNVLVKITDTFLYVTEIHWLKHGDFSITF